MEEEKKVYVYKITYEDYSTQIIRSNYPKKQSDFIEGVKVEELKETKK